MEKQFEKLVEIRNQKGEVIWSVWLTSDQAKDIRERITEQESPGNKNNGGKGPEQTTGGSNEEPMTDAQKRYIFRLLAKRGIEGDAAYQHLKDAFHVDSIKQITKLDASQAIDKMVNG
jgi:hypothetical protein